MSSLRERIEGLTASWRKRAENSEAAIKHQGWGDATLVYILIGCADELAAALVAEGPGDERIWCMECGKSVSTPVPKDTIMRAWVECPECIEKRAAAPSLHKEELQVKFTRALANNNILEQMILANWKAGSEPAANPANSINLNGLINDLVDLLGAALHKEGAGGGRDSEGSEMYWAEPSKPQPKGLVAYKCPNCDCLINIAFQHEADIRERIRREALEEAALICERQGKDLMETHDDPMLKTPESDTILKQQAASAFGCAWAIRQLAAASPAGRAEP